MALNPRRAAFLKSYLECGNATQAALKAGYSPKTAAAQGSRLLSNAEIASSLKAKAAKVDLTVERAVEELGKVALTDIQSYKGSDKVKALELFLKLTGKLKDHHVVETVLTPEQIAERLAPLFEEDDEGEGS